MSSIYPGRRPKHNSPPDNDGAGTPRYFRSHKRKDTISDIGVNLDANLQQSAIEHGAEAYGGIAFGSRFIPLPHPETNKSMSTTYLTQYHYSQNRIASNEYQIPPTSHQSTTDVAQYHYSRNRVSSDESHIPPKPYQSPAHTTQRQLQNEYKQLPPIRAAGTQDNTEVLSTRPQHGYNPGGSHSTAPMSSSSTVAEFPPQQGTSPINELNPLKFQSLGPVSGVTYRIS